MSFFLTPERRSPSCALTSSRSVINELKRATTIANRRPAPRRAPSIAAISGSGTGSTVILFFVSSSPYLRVALCPLWLKALDAPVSSVSPVVETRRSLPLKRGRPLLQKCRSPFLLIFRRASHGKKNGLQIKPLAQSHLHASVDGLHRVLHSQRSVRNNLRRNRLRPRHQLRRRGHFIDQPNAMRLLGRDHLPGQHHLHRDPLAHQPRQPLRSPIPRNNPQLHLRLPQLRVLAREAHRASKRQFAPTPKRESVDAGNHGL